VIRNDSGEAVATGARHIAAVADAMSAEATIAYLCTSLCLRLGDGFLGI
jgi:hypothetical protein